ncbi:MAG TPA: GNAT family N-acetyltransferase [Burkholderiales bacterium]|nr:GNAT family N-acetyltransferase [Burkholderiales bacterium]
MSSAYPSELESEWQAPDGTPVTIRPIRPEDEGIETAFVASLTPESRYLRFMSALNELTPGMLEKFTHVDYARDMALIAVVKDQERAVQIAVARYVLERDGKSCEFAIVVGEKWRGRGLGRHLLLRLVEIARARGVKAMTGLVLSVNQNMLAMAVELGFAIEDSPDDFSVKQLRLYLR